jgi:demethylmenaquinone methyltransferase/2-methoxy-6-polyprenyl-1,4-benzoquinol methylase
VFDSVAGNYDLMNDLMSLGVHRIWKRDFAASSGIGPGNRVLDLAGGTGDIATLLSKRVGANGRVVLSDINEAMLSVGRQRLEDQGIVGNVSYAIANAENLPFESGEFDAVTIAFGLRNVTDKNAALREMYRVLKPGGRALILEFSSVKPEPLKAIYDAWSFGALPILGKLIADDEDSYRYLAESIRQHPPQEELAEMMENAGFSQVRYRNLTGGIVAIHSGVHA